VQRSDILQWFDVFGSALQRLPVAIARSGISVLDAHRVASPLRPTAAGNELLGLDKDASRLPRQTDTVELLNQRLPELLYAYRTHRGLLAHLRCSTGSLNRMVSSVMRDEAERFARAASQTEVLVVPLPRRRGGEGSDPRPG
jgi:hypothetical protein